MTAELTSIEVLALLFPEPPMAGSPVKTVTAFVLDPHLGLQLQSVVPNRNLLQRVQDPLAGAVRFDDVDVRDVTQASLRGQIGHVMQTPLLFDAMARGEIHGELHGGRWTDVGTPERLAALDASLSERA